MEMQELADILREMYDTAPEGEKDVQLCLFGIVYAKELDCFPPTKVRTLSGIRRHAVNEINIGRSLAKYVKPKYRRPRPMTAASISEEQVQTLADLVGIPIDAADLPEVANRFSSLMRELAQLQDLDLEGIEPVAIFPDTGASE